MSVQIYWFISMKDEHLLLICKSYWIYKYVRRNVFQLYYLLPLEMAKEKCIIREVPRYPPCFSGCCQDPRCCSTGIHSYSLHTWPYDVCSFVSLIFLLRNWCPTLKDLLFPWITEDGLVKRNYPLNWKIRSCDSIHDLVPSKGPNSMEQ